MDIKDRRNDEAPNVFRFDQLEQGWTVEGVETGQIYYVVLDPGFTNGKRLVNLNKKVLQNPDYCNGRYRRIYNAHLVLPSQPTTTT